ncbi:rod shape-determining protein MreD [Acidiluteibacter ferrifornacis]|uniref:Rod shape-determining protein MreD n=1 Tax=Acidiluteibacter ferrifornacis TaxID=2692424 RepID=A0A6N9NG04_9FLAO|nr:rod shape-determining protein MreD [Acidiluteibacter ferrifornacis]MBR9830716.1 rod shape-determining protein MreD [bacterium]NBG64732.1 rod shape-determining protein MreD [Acidiluteibacter ferrifornacis]
MIKQILNFTLLFVFLVLLQVLVLNNIQLSGYINPYFYVLFILLLPFETANWLLLILAFALGISIDVFSSTMGMHTSALLLMAFLRPSILKLISPRDGYDSNQSPSIQDFDFRWFAIYVSVLVFAHHFVLFFIEAFRFSDFFYTLTKVILSSLLTILLIFISQLFTYNSQAKR